MKHKLLLSRDQFREAVKQRDGHKCIFCDTTEQLDAHHIIERRLFTEPNELGGYFIDNGATVCQVHHMAVEETLISVEEVREAAGITTKIVPSYFYAEDVIDKWGNLILPNGTRTIGPLMNDESVQWVLRKVQHLFTKYVKYGRTLHLPWSESVNEDDRVVTDMSQWEGRYVVVTEKMDGENTTIYNDYMHARSVDGRSHPSRDLLKAWASRFQHDIPDLWRICGENLYARHSIAYENLMHHFAGFSIWDENNIRLGWDDTLFWFEVFGILPVPTLYYGVYNEKKIKSLWNDSMRDKSEGYVMTLAEPIHYRDFKKWTLKFVRKNHVQTIKHWMHGQPIVPNTFLNKF